MGESPTFERPTTPEDGDEFLTSEEKSELYLERSKYLLEQRGIDSLTGVKNRFAFQEDLDRILKFVRGDIDAHRAGIEPIGEVSLIFIDLDNFGQVNKLIGHLAGDEVLKKAVEIIKGSVREETDIVGRFGGDEFFVLLPRANEETAKERANTILANLQSDAKLQELGVGASIGISSSVESTDPTALVHFADEAARHAKQSGKNRIEVYSGI
jgi:diguanylate cyclase (GGDEF)-like protein